MEKYQLNRKRTKQRYVKIQLKHKSIDWGKQGNSRIQSKQTKYINWYERTMTFTARETVYFLGKIIMKASLSWLAVKVFVYSIPEKRKIIRYFPAHWDKLPQFDPLKIYTPLKTTTIKSSRRFFTEFTPEKQCPLQHVRHTLIYSARTSRRTHRRTNSFSSVVTNLKTLGNIVSYLL